jgi:hypothetical protein
MIWFIDDEYSIVIFLLNAVNFTILIVYLRLKRFEWEH